MSPIPQEDEHGLCANALVSKDKFTIYIDSSVDDLLYDGLCQITFNTIDYKNAMKMLNALKNCIASLYAEAITRRDDICKIMEPQKPSEISPIDFVIKDVTKKLLLPHSEINIRNDEELEIIRSIGVIDESRIINEK